MLTVVALVLPKVSVPAVGLSKSVVREVRMVASASGTVKVRSTDGPVMAKIPSPTPVHGWPGFGVVARAIKRPEKESPISKQVLQIKRNDLLLKLMYFLGGIRLSILYIGLEHCLLFIPLSLQRFLHSDGWLTSLAFFLTFGCTRFRSGPFQMRCSWCQLLRIERRSWSSSQSVPR